jgi:hypothetical protein
VDPHAHGNLVVGHNRGSLLVDYLFFLTQTIHLLVFLQRPVWT